MDDRERQLAERVCTSCDNWAASGYVYCLACLHGESYRASDEAIAAKKKKMQEESREQKRPSPR